MQAGGPGAEVPHVPSAPGRRDLHAEHGARHGARSRGAPRPEADDLRADGARAGFEQQRLLRGLSPAERSIEVQKLHTSRVLCHAIKTNIPSVRSSSAVLAGPRPPRLAPAPLLLPSVSELRRFSRARLPELFLAVAAARRPARGFPQKNTSAVRGGSREQHWLLAAGDELLPRSTLTSARAARAAGLLRR